MLSCLCDKQFGATGLDKSYDEVKKYERLTAAKETTANL